MAIGAPSSNAAEAKLSRKHLSDRALRTIRVCHVSVSLKTGGLERILAGLAKHTPRDQSVLAFVALRDEGRFADEIRQTGAQVTTLKCLNRWSMVRQLRALLTAGKFDLVHTHNTYPHLYGTLAARMAHVPIVINTRHGQRSGHGWKSRWLFRFASHWVDRVVAVSDDAAQLCRQVDGLPETKVTRIWNGIDINDFAYQGSTLMPTAITVGRLVPEKGIDTLIRAMAIAVVTLPELRLRIVGDGPLRPSLEQLARELKIASQVEFCGEQTNVAEALNSAGFYVSSSLTEGISLTLLEAMSVGLPAIATKVGGNPEIVIEPASNLPGTGLLVEPSDPNAMASALVSICRQSHQWTAMGLAARERVVHCFEVHTMVEQYQKLYRELLENARS